MPKKLNVGNLLISEPFLPEEPFFRKLIVLIECNEEGTLGVIINETLPNSISITVQDKPELDFTFPLLNGGPVGNSADEHLGFIYTGSATKSSTQISDNFHYLTDLMELLEAMENNSINPLRTFAVSGYCGWAVGQLEAEINEKTWIVSSFTDHYMNLKGDIAWKSALKDLGGELALLANAPEDVQWN